MSNDGNLTAHGCHVAGFPNDRWKYPLTIKAVIHDLDGTLMPTYRTLLGVDVADQLLQKVLEQVAVERRPDAAPRFIHHIAQIPRQTTLHLVEKTLRTVEEFAATQMKITVPAHIKKEVGEILDNSFKFYPGAREFLKIIDALGTFSAIYTNTPDYFSSTRMTTAMDRENVDPRIIHATYTKIKPSHEPLSWMAKDESPTRQAIGERMIPYGYAKPDDTPIREIMRITGAKPHEILMMGDSSNDLLSVYKDPRNPLGIFALQEYGAKDICERQQKVHKTISPGAEQLGLEAVNAEINRLRVERDIIRLPHGHLTLLRLMDEGYISFAPPDVMPMAVNRQLISAHDAVGPHKVARVAGTEGPGGAR